MKFCLACLNLSSSSSWDIAGKRASLYAGPLAQQKHAGESQDAPSESPTGVSFTALDYVFFGSLASLRSSFAGSQALWHFSVSAAWLRILEQAHPCQ